MLKPEPQFCELRGPLGEEYEGGEQCRELLRLSGVAAQRGDALLRVRFDICGERIESRAQRDALGFQQRLCER